MVLARSVPRRGPVNSPAQLRGRAFRLAKTDGDAALAVARGIPDPWYRAQALAAVARWIAKHRVAAIARESLASAEACDDDYKRAAVAAWPIRALVERGHEPLAREALANARRHALAATPAASQAEALLGLLQGAWDLGSSTRRQLVEDLAAVHRQDTFWRVGRALVNALEMLGGTDPELAREIAAAITDDRCRSKALRAIDTGRTCGPRDYFED